MIEYNIYLGLKDKYTKTQLVIEKDIIKLITSICEDKKVEFYLTPIYGGYIDKEGEYIKEESIKITFFNIEKKKVIEMSKLLKSMLNQESIIITKKKQEVYVI